MTIETKLNIDDKCFFLLNNKVVEDKIFGLKAEIRKGRRELVYILGGNSDIDESEVFSSKQSLLDSL